MVSKDFNQVVFEQFELCKNLLTAKGEEYSLDEDRLLVFRKAASIQGETPKQALCGMLAKHVVSIFDMSMSSQDFAIEKWNEKITDAMNYLVLLKALITEENHETT